MSISIAWTILVVTTLASADGTAELPLTGFLHDGRELDSPAASMRDDDSRSSDVRENVWFYLNDGALRDDEVATTRQEKKERNCTPHSIQEFPKDLFTAEQRQRGAVVLHTFFGFYCFLLTAFVCNDYLLPSLDIVCTRLKISSDVAGATFLATASCFPELFVNVIGTFLTESDLGVGTVMGGAVFNTFATPACGALSALYAIQLEWRILTRDCIMYVISVGTLVIIMWDGLIKWYEATILMVMFVAYLTILFCGKTFVRWHNKLAHLYCGGKSGGTVFNEEESPKGKEESMSNGLYRPYFHGELMAEYRKSMANNSVQKHFVNDALPNGANSVEAQNQAEPVEEYVAPGTTISIANRQPEAARIKLDLQQDTPFVWPTGGKLAKLWFWFVWPIRLMLFVTIPDSRYKRCRNWYLVTFVMCVIWIAISSYLVSWMMTVLGDTLRIPDSIMGLTFLAVGGNMPELVSIVILSRQGNGDMAMSNTLGSNTLDILLCLGLPWFIKTMMTGRSVRIVSGALSYSVLSIIVCVVIFYAVIATCKYQLNKKVGIICLVLYTIFLTFAIMVEMNVFFQANLPMC